MSKECPKAKVPTVRLSSASISPCLQTVGQGASEESVGIESFLNQAPGFSGVLKQKYSDFLVCEVSLDKKVVSFSGPSMLVWTSCFVPRDVLIN